MEKIDRCDIGKKGVKHKREFFSRDFKHIENREGQKLDESFTEFPFSLLTIVFEDFLFYIEAEKLVE